MIKKIRWVCILCIFSIVLNLWCVFASASISAVDLKLTGQRTGNIFFDGDIPSFDIVFKNYNSEDTFTITYEINKKELDESLVSVYSAEKAEVLSRGESIKRVFMYEEELSYGIYELSVSVSDSSKKVLCTKTTEFSKVIRNDVQNPHHGVCVHLVRMGDAETELSLAKNAGFSMVRDDFTWYEYETSKGDKKLSARQKSFLKKAKKYGLDVLAIVGGDSPFYISDGYEKNHSTLPTDLGEFKNFVESLLNEEEFDVVKRIEVQNEPQACCVNVDGAHYCMIKDGKFNTELADYNILGSRYAQQVIAADEVIKRIRPDVEIGAMSLCLMDRADTDNFITSVCNYFNTSNGEVMPFDAMTIHPYYTRNVSGRTLTIGETVEYYQTIAENNGFDAENSGLWCTEYGIATSDDVSQTAQAKRIINDYAQILSLNFENSVYVYDMADDSGTFGLLKHSSSSEIPYAAKLSYLAVSALNKMVNGSNNCTEISIKDSDENDLAAIFDFSYTNGDVYMIQPKAEGTDVLNYDFGNGELHYYDMLGNEISEEESNECFKDNIPYYVMRNMQMSKTEDKFFKVSGNIASGAGDKNVSLTVLAGSDEFDENMYGKIKYADQIKTDSDGGFEFRFDLNDADAIDRLVGYVVSDDNHRPIIFSIKGVETLQLYSGADKINSFNLDFLNLKNASVKVDFDQVSESKSYNLVCGFYKENRLTYIKICPAAADTDIYDISVDDEIKFNSVRIFMFNDLMDCMPLCDATVIGQK